MTCPYNKERLVCDKNRYIYCQTKRARTIVYDEDSNRNSMYYGKRSSVRK